MKRMHAISFFAILFLSLPVFGQEPPSDGEAWAKEFLQSIKPQTGTIELPNGIAELKLGDKFYFLNAADSKKVLEEAWGNPPNGDVLGMIFPADSNPLAEDSWAVTVEYEEDGYVSDEEADKINYDKMLKTMKEDVADNNKERVEAGYDSIELVGWASKPYYDSASHKLHWAKELKFGDSDENTLNYNIRVLGRKGVLVLNFVATMAQIDEINSRLPDVLAATEFTDGNRYADFDPSSDKVAAYGIGALVAGTVASKLGFFAKFLLIFKKLGIMIVIGIGALYKKFFGRKGEA